MTLFFPPSAPCSLVLYNRGSVVSPMKLIPKVSPEKKQLTCLTGTFPVVLGTGKWLNVLLDLVGDSDHM